MAMDPFNYQINVIMNYDLYTSRNNFSLGLKRKNLLLNEKNVTVIDII